MPNSSVATNTCQKVLDWGTWVDQSVKHPTLSFSLGHDLTVRESEPHMGIFIEGAGPAWDSLSLLCVRAHTHTLSQYK